MNPERILKGTFLLAAFASFLLSVTLYFQADGDIEGRLNAHTSVSGYHRFLRSVPLFLHIGVLRNDQKGLFIAGSIVSVVVFTGGFLYAMLSFGRWADRDDATPRTPPKQV